MGGMRVQATSPSLGAASVRIQGMRGRYTRFLSDGLPLFGEQVYRSLAEAPEGVDVVQVFRPSAEATEIARLAVAMGARALWLQSGLRSEEARRIAEAAGLDYVENECTAVTSSLYLIKKEAAA